MKYIVFIWLFILSGCASVTPHREPTVTLHADTAFTDDERSCIKLSADKWAAQTNGVADINVVYDYNAGQEGRVRAFKSYDRLVRWDSAMPQVQAFDSDGGNLLGLVQPSGGIHNEKGAPVQMSLVADRLSDPHTCQLTAIHEFGHVLGVPHLDNKPGNIMFPEVLHTRTACLKPDDLAAFCLVNDCGRVKMDPCPDQTPEELHFNAD